jgi:farnesyl-diphosphate farnesyltransferase
MRMPTDLKNAVGAGYLCLRAIDEIEDHPELEPDSKIELLNGIADIFSDSSGTVSAEALARLFAPHSDRLSEVSLSIAELAELAPESIRPRVQATTADMATAMAGWVVRDWRIETEADLDQYTFDVAGRVGLLLSDIWQWHSHIKADRDLAIDFGRVLQAVNIVRNRKEDMERGADFFPDNWDERRLIEYARRKIDMADSYMDQLPQGPIFEFCQIPLELAKATLAAIENGEEKLTREDVNNLMIALNMA